MKDTQLVDLFQKARNDKALAVIEGVQALKHAVRFSAEIQEYITCDVELLENLVEELAEDVKDSIISNITIVEEAIFNKLSPQPPRTKVIALAKRRDWALNDVNKTKPIVFLEDPRDLENIGAVIRVSAAADIAAVVISGPADIWHPAVIRGGAGLQYALPVFSHASLNDELTHKRKIISLDPAGKNIASADIPNNAVLVFGTERHGISKSTLEKSNEIASLNMKAGVSSLNLATSVAATLYSLR